MFERKKIAVLERQNNLLQGKVAALEKELERYKALESAMLDAKAKYIESIAECKDVKKIAQDTTSELQGLLKSLKDLYRR